MNRINQTTIKTLSLSTSVKEFINEYFELQIDNKQVKCPYFIADKSHIRFGLIDSTYLGKGTPEKITKETSALKIRGSEEQIRSQMRDRNIGVDCSGFVYNILLRIFKELDQDITELLPSVSLFDIRKFLSRIISPENSVSAKDFTGAKFSHLVELNEIRPGDLIKTWGGKHILIVTDVIYEQNQRIVNFVHSTKFFGKDNGVREEKIIIPNSCKNLIQAKWESGDTEYKNYTYSGFRYKSNINGVYRVAYFDSFPVHYEKKK